MKELRLGLKGRTLVFPDDRSFCLVCGAEPAGTRRVWFEDIEHRESDALHLGSKSHALGTGIRTIRDRIDFDAPLCRAHRRRAAFLGLQAAGLMLLAVGVLVLGIVALKQFKIPKNYQKIADWLPFVPALIPAVFGGLLWKRKDRGGLTCTATILNGELHLSYEGDAPPAAVDL